MFWNQWLDKTMRKIIYEAEKEFKDEGVSFDQIVEILNITFASVAMCMGSKKMPSILFTGGIGSFNPSFRKINLTAEKIKDIDPEASEYMRAVCNRIIKEKIKRRNGNYFNRRRKGGVKSEDKAS